MKILIADDRETSRELIRTLLEHDGYEILEAVDGEQTLEIARSASPDLILLDIHMPRVDGYTAVRELRRDERLRNLPIVALTASAMRSDRDEAIKSGFTAYITKPVDLMELRNQVAKLLGRERGGESEPRR